MNRVERAIILAAGKGERMRPLTLTTPKPLLKVFNQPIIEHSIELLLQKGITEIYIVVGYLAEQFQYLANKYGVTIIKNEQYDSCNNISSLFLVRDRLKNAVVLDGDIWISDDNILLKEFDHSGYTSVWTDTFVNEWVQHTDDAGFVTRCARNGDENGWILYSISYWSEDDAAQLKTDIETEFLSRRHTDLFWDDVAMFCYPEKYTLKIKPVQSGALSEFDNIQELAAFDETYKEVLL